MLALAAVAQAAQVTFRVVAPGAASVSVLVNGQQTALSAADPTVPYFTGVAETGADSKYKYQAGGVAETFDRPLLAGRTSTQNDFINRPVTYADIPALPWPIETDVSVLGCNETKNKGLAASYSSDTLAMAPQYTNQPSIHLSPNGHARDPSSPCST